MQYRVSVEALREAYTPSKGDMARIEALAKQHVPEDLARDWSLMRHLVSALDVALLAHDTGQQPARVASLYGALGSTIGLDRLRRLATRFSPPEHWDRLALRRLMDDLSQSQRGIAARLLRSSMDLESWAAKQGEALERTRGFLNALEGSGELSVAKLMLASSQVQSLA